ncbi:Pycsar system effector family protein [Aquimonas sp.]|jgi:hypothetical protein|uniref:Pycsar system effector family protein n=1 Tax=Aquimonas sp. TaxID=1872588 RepID=UPI0037C17A73
MSSTEPAEASINSDAAASSDPFQRVIERNTADVMLRTAQQHHVQLSTMADIKANILITVSSIVLTMSLRQVSDPEMKLAMAVLSGFTLFALFLAVLAVLPKYRPIKLKDPDAPLPSGFNLLFFGHFAELKRERFEREVANVLQGQGDIYRTMARDLYGLGYYLSHFKYRYLRLSYLFFLAGFVLSSLIQGVQLLY